MKNIITYDSYKINEASSIKKACWQMDRDEWLAAGKPDHGMNSCKPTFSTDIKQERQAIVDFIGIFKNPLDAIKKSVIGVPRSGMDMKNRDTAFAKKSCWHIVSTALKHGEGFTEDAREAIIVGRLLGYADYHILGYIFRNYILRDVFKVDITKVNEIYERFKDDKLTKNELVAIKEMYPALFK